MRTGSAEKPLPWYAEGLCFSCRECGACCTGEPGDVWVTEEEIERIAEYMGLSVEQFGREYVRRRMFGGKSLKEHANGDCVMLADHRCSVYNVRPKQCRAWPFWRETLKSRRAWESYARRCPGMNSGRLYSREEIEKEADMR